MSTCRGNEISEPEPEHEATNIGNSSSEELELSCRQLDISLLDGVWQCTVLDVQITFVQGQQTTTTMQYTTMVFNIPCVFPPNLIQNHNFQLRDVTSPMLMIEKSGFDLDYVVQDNDVVGITIDQCYQDPWSSICTHHYPKSCNHRRLIYTLLANHQLWIDMVRANHRHLIDMLYANCWRLMNMPRANHQRLIDMPRANTD